MAELRGGGNRKWDGIFEKESLKVKWGMRDGNSEALAQKFARRPKTVSGASGGRSAGASSGTGGGAFSGISSSTGPSSGGGINAAGPSPYARPVIVKAKYYDKARTGGKNMAGVLLRYMEKDGRLFGRDEDREIDRREVERNWMNDRLLWHFIESPNDGHAMTDDEMKVLARETIERWEQRLGPLDWVACVESKPDAAHPDGNRHLHIAVRGVQDSRDLWIDEEMFSKQTLRFDAMEAATDRLGYMNERELLAYERQIEAGRLARGEGRDLDLERSAIERAMDEEMARFELDRNSEFWEQDRGGI